MRFFNIFENFVELLLEIKTSYHDFFEIISRDIQNFYLKPHKVITNMSLPNNSFILENYLNSCKKLDKYHDNNDVDYMQAMNQINNDERQ